MNKILCKKIILVLCFSIGLSACSENKNENSTNTYKQAKIENTATNEADKKNIEENIESKEEPVSEINIKLSNLYNKVLDDIDSYTFEENAEQGDINYTYSLVNMNDSDIPQLIVAQNNIEYGLSYIKVFHSNDNFTKAITSDEVIQIGVASAGGFRGFLAQNEDLNGLDYITVSSGTGEGFKEEIIASVDKDNLILQRDTVWEGSINELPDANTSDIDFIDIVDRNKLDDLATIKDGEYKKTIAKKIDELKSLEEARNSEENSTINDQTQEEIDNGRMVVSGTVKVFTNAEMVSYQDQNPQIFPDMGENYVILLLDDYADINMKSSSDPYYMTYSVNIIKLPDDMADYVDQRITVSFGPDDGYWQSDASLPVGAPRMNTVNILE